MTQPKVRKAEDRPSLPRKTAEDVFAGCEPEKPQKRNVLEIDGLDKELFGCFANATPARIAELQRLGYRPIDDVRTEMGVADDGWYTGESGSHIKVMVCREAYRQKRIEDQRKTLAGEKKATFQEDVEKDGEMPVAGHRKTPPKGYFVNPT